MWILAQAPGPQACRVLLRLKVLLTQKTLSSPRPLVKVQRFVGATELSRSWFSRFESSIESERHGICCSKYRIHSVASSIESFQVLTLQLCSRTLRAFSLLGRRFHGSARSFEHWLLQTFGQHALTCARPQPTSTHAFERSLVQTTGQHPRTGMCSQPAAYVSHKLHSIRMLFFNSSCCLQNRALAPSLKMVLALFRLFLRALTAPELWTVYTNMCTTSPTSPCASERHLLQTFRQEAHSCFCSDSQHAHVTSYVWIGMLFFMEVVTCRLEF